MARMISYEEIEFCISKLYLQRGLIHSMATASVSANLEEVMAAGRPGRLTTSDGVAVAYTLWTGDPTRPAIVLHHGFAASTMTNWVTTGVVAGLRTEGLTVLSIDARGHGLSDKPHDPARYGEARMASDLIELLDRLALKQVDLFGYSMGAVVALLVASSIPGIRRLIVGGVGDAVLVCGGIDTRGVSADLLADALLADDASAISDPGAAGFRLFAERSGNDLLALAAQARRIHQSPIALAQITAPTLVLAGTEDVLARHADRLAEAIPGARWQAVPGDHLNAVRQPALLKAVNDFLGA